MTGYAWGLCPEQQTAVLDALQVLAQRAGNIES